MARSFANNTTDHINCGNSATLNPAAFTIALWGNFATFTHTNDSGEAWLFARDDAALGRAYAFGLGTLPSVPKLEFQYAGSLAQSSPVILTTNAWYHLAVTAGAAAGATHCFLNGAVSDNSSSAAFTPVSTTGSTTIGARTYSTFEGYNGESIADVGLWSVALIAAEINALAKGARPNTIRTGSLIGYWPLDGLSSPEPDLSGNHFNGTLTGTALAPGPPIMPFTPLWWRYERPPLSSQQVMFRLVNAATGTPLSGASVTPFVTKDNAAQVAGNGDVQNLGNGQYRYIPALTEAGATDLGLLFTAPGAIPVNLDVHADLLSSNTKAGYNASMGAVARGTVQSGGSTTSVQTSALAVVGATATGLVLNQFAGRTLVFDGNTTTAGLRGATVLITASSISNPPVFTVTPALPASPATGDLFSVV